ncbi:MAG: flavin reductase family protein [Chitinophagaceae bacterium]|jgi:flavin reductase (DIM6/NTAB) family NADH-FMN oxidoreductase RutF|nr:flavin reductase family protein [Chitinophagaceae bacterium]
MKKVNINELTPMRRQQWLQHVIAPRPIGLVSTIDAEGRANLSPFSFFNIFSSTPPILVFSPARRVRDNTTKHTLDNVIAVPEAVIHIVDESIVHRASLSSCEYPEGIDEFTMAGFTPIPAEHVRPPRVAESKVQLECRVLEVKPLGQEGGAGNLVICEVLTMHVNESVLNEAGDMIDPFRLTLVARLGADWYCRVNEGSLFEVEKPNQQLGIGFPGLPAEIRHSRILNGEQLARLANVTSIPDAIPSFDDPHVRQIVQYFSNNPEEMEIELHKHAARLVNEGHIADAWQVLLHATAF